MSVNGENHCDEKQTIRQRLSHWVMVFRQSPRVMRMAWKAWPIGTIAMPALTIVAGAVPALSLYFLKKIIDGLTLWTSGDMAGRKMVFLFLSLEVVALLAQHGLSLLIQFIQTVMEARLRFHIQDNIMRSSLELDMSFFDTPSFYDKLQRAQREVGFRPFSIITALVQGAKEFTTLIGFLAIIVSLAWWLAPYVIIVGIPALIVQSKYGWQGWIIASGRTPKERQMAYFNNLLTSNREFKEIRLFGLGEHIAKRWRDLFWEFYRQDVKLAGHRRLAEFGAVIFETMAYAGFYVYAIYRCMSYLSPETIIGSVIMYTQAMERATDSIGLIMRSIANFYENNLYLNNLFEYQAQKPLVTTPATPRPVPDPMRKGIRFENVTFCYPGSGGDILRNISLEIPAGRRIALVGENGAGKTTLIKLLSRLYDPQQGRITVDGIDLRELDLEQWRRSLGVIFQDFVQYCVTARENIGFGDLTQLDNLPRIREVAELSGAKESIERLSKQWDTMLGKVFDDGQELSIGEWQKVALARAFLRQSPILVLDEPTASLDAKQEYEIFRQFDKLTQGKTTVLISHRFSSVRMAEHIFVIEKGGLVEQGSHDELMGLNNRYAELFNRQAAAYR